MTTIGWLPAPVEDLFGPEATAEESYEVLTVDVPPTSWIPALEAARDELGCTYFDWLSAVDEPGTGFRVAAHVAALSPVRRLLVRTTVPHEAPTLPSAIGVYAGAAWHERETHEMFGVAFTDHPALDHLLLPENFEGHPLRKDFVLAARVAKAWPGAKEPGESEHGGPKRRQILPPGVPDPNEWGPLKGQLPPAPTRPARGAARTAGERPTRATGERPVRRTRTSSEGSASQTEAPAAGGAPTGAPAAGAARRARTAAEGSASQTEASAGAEPATGPARRTRTAAEGSVSQQDAASPAETSAGEPVATDSENSPEAGGSPAGTGTPPTTSGTPTVARRTRSANEGSASQRTAETSTDATTEGAPASNPRSADAPWHHARPAFDEPALKQQPEPAPEPEPAPGPEPESVAEPASEPKSEAQRAPESKSEAEPQTEAETQTEAKSPSETPAKPDPSDPAATPEGAEDSTDENPDHPDHPDRTDPSGGPQ
ncbi:NADH-quinone oxidoreductase subunit C [Streptomyces sp. NBC_01017]|uniref:NADH-quinone oxidoreductase subunit C n=1 Tax=Streptomyces sp. NBC_01017 TaxID=2903721 RepID=UPI00386EA6E6|nr:NADH-quinone oxidoreductase subunit C [Streptomyces sp. NBC_01017]